MNFWGWLTDDRVSLLGFLRSFRKPEKSRPLRFVHRCSKCGSQKEGSTPQYCKVCGGWLDLVIVIGEKDGGQK